MRLYAPSPRVFPVERERLSSVESLVGLEEIRQFRAPTIEKYCDMGRNAAPWCVLDYLEVHLKAWKPANYLPTLREAAPRKRN